MTYQNQLSPKPQLFYIQYHFNLLFLEVKWNNRLTYIISVKENRPAMALTFI